MNMEEELQLFIRNLNGMDEYRLPQRAYHTIRLAIRDLILPPGTALLEREISEALQMSRTPVREALVRLELEGVLRLVPRRGFIVAPIEQEDLKEVYEIITRLDSLAIETATANALDAELDHLDAIIEEQQAALLNGDLKQWSLLDDSFHTAIIDYAHNKRLKAVIDSFADQSYRARLFTIEKRPIPLHSITEHKAIVFCMRAKDGKAASMLIESHRKRAQKEILEVLDEINNTQIVNK